jgi:hypothetical protein
LRKIELHILDWVVGLPFQNTSIWIESRTPSDNPFEFMGDMVWSHTTWDIVWTAVLLKPFRVIVNMFVAIVTVCLGIPFVWCLPSLLLILEDAAEGERMRSGSISSSVCCCCCCYNELDVEYGNNGQNVQNSQGNGYQKAANDHRPHSFACNLM